MEGSVSTLNRSVSFVTVVVIDLKVRHHFHALEYF